MPARQSADFLIAFGQAVREVRHERQLSQESLANEVGIHRTYIGDVERGRRNVGLINVHRIAVALGIRPSELIRSAEAVLSHEGK